MVSDLAVLSKNLDYRLFDADNHYYEPMDVFAQYIDPEFAERTFVTKEEDGRRVVFLDGRPYGHVSGEGNRQRIRPGALRQMLRGEVPEQDDEIDDSYNAEPGPRLEMMDRQGIEATLMFPGLGVTLENMMRHDEPLLLAHVRAFNRWLDAHWSFNTADRIISPAYISLLDVDEAVAQLEFALERGAKAIDLLPGPGRWGVSPADAIYDPFWSRVNEAGLLVTYHLGNAGFIERYSGDWGEDPDPDGYSPTAERVGGKQGGHITGQEGGRSAFQWAMLYRDRPIMETIAILIFHNLFGRYPNIKVASIENGSVWVPYLLKALDNMKGMGRMGPWPNGYVEGRPSEVFKRHVLVSPHHFGEDIHELIELVGAEQVMFGSDFPHGEGMSAELDYFEKAGEFAARLNEPDDITKKVMRDNGMRLLGLDR